jgi:NADH:ubiquinone oxidoreductase subunit 6 (subunit J)
MKKIRFFVLVAISIFASLQSSTHAQSDTFYYNTQKIEATTDLAKVIKENNISDSNNIDNKNSSLYKIRGYFQLNGTIYDGNTPATGYVKNLLNIALGLTSFISLILVIFAFYLILFDKGEEGVKKAKKILIGVAIAIALMGLSWIIVSFFFSLYTTEAIKNI